MKFGRTSLATLALVVFTVLAVMLHFTRQALVDPAVPFFAREAPGEWILFPVAPSTYLRSRTELTTKFFRSFDLASVPHRAHLRLKMHVTGDVAINGTQITLAPGSDDNWKSERTADVASVLRAGPNTLVATTRARFGPASLWLVLDCDGTVIASDANWKVSVAGSHPRPARLATLPMDEWSRPTARSITGEIGSDALNPSPWAALRKTWPNYIVLAAAAAALVFSLLTLKRKYALSFDNRTTWMFTAAAALVFAALFWNNRTLDINWGFDPGGHADYVNHMLKIGTVPSADQGWEMYQPPLYYAVVAFVLKVNGYAALDESSIHLARAVGWAALVLQTLFVALGLRELFADRPRTAFVGACVAALLPMHLYLFQYTSNEGFAAMLVSAAVWLALRILHTDDSRLRNYVSLGFVLGAALLTKFSALLAVVVTLGVFAGRLVLRRDRAPRLQLRNLVATTTVIALVCGWFYLGVHERFGRFFVGNFDEDVGFTWWQDPGFRVTGYFTRFGAVFEHPLFSSLHSCWDALYSTLFGDALIGGNGRVDMHPPWNYDLMSAGMLLALLPALALGIGLIISLAQLVRSPRAAWFLVLGLLAGTLAAQISLTLRLPFCGQTKAVYAALAMIPLCATIALGLEWIAGRVRAAAPLLWTLLATWLLASFATFWSMSSEPQLSPRTLADTVSDAGGELSALAGAVAQFPDDKGAHAQLALGRIGRREFTEAAAAARDGIAVDPWDPLLHYVLGVALHRSGDVTGAIEQLDYAARLNPLASSYALDLSALLIMTGHHGEAETVLERTRSALTKLGQPIPQGITERLTLCREKH